jgi:hypothetical protein
MDLAFKQALIEEAYAAAVANSDDPNAQLCEVTKYLRQLIPMRRRSELVMEVNPQLAQ